MTGPLESRGTAVICTARGEVQTIVADALSIFPDPAEPNDLFGCVDRASRYKLTGFLERIREQQTAMGWEINTRTGEEVTPLYFFGVAHEEDRVFVVISPMPENIIYLYDQMIGVVNDQSVMLRTCQQELRDAREQNQAEPTGYDEFMRLNNDLINTQRELNIRNRMLAKQEERTRRLFDINPDALLMLSDQGEAVAANIAARQLFGVTEDELDTIRLKLPESGNDDEMCIMRDGQPVMVEVRSIRTDWNGRDATLLSLRDITQRKELEALKEDVERISRHDLKSPLSGIIGLAQLMVATEEGETAEYSSLILDAARRTLNIIDNSLSLYRMECGQYKFVPEPVPLAPLLSRVASDLSTLASANGVEVILKGPEGPDATIPGEPSLYEILFANLIKNAIEASPEGESVTIGWQCDATCTVTVHNQGAVPAPVRAAFFEKYATHGKRDGNGLGTYSARLIARTLGGDLSMTTDEATGTTLAFTITTG